MGTVRLCPAAVRDLAEIDESIEREFGRDVAEQTAQEIRERVRLD